MDDACQAYDTTDCGKCVQPSHSRCKAMCRSTERRCNRAQVTDLDMCWQHFTMHSNVELRPISHRWPNEVALVYELQKKVKDCYFFHDLSQRTFARLCRKYNTWVLAVGGRIYGFVMYETLDRVLDHRVVYVNYTCALSKGYPNKPPLPVGYAMWATFVHMLRHRYPNDLVMILNESTRCAQFYHRSNCMVPLPDDIVPAVVRVLEKRRLSLGYFFKGTDYTKEAPAFHTKCFVPTVPGVRISRGRITVPSVRDLARHLDEQVLRDTASFERSAAFDKRMINEKLKVEIKRLPGLTSRQVQLLEEMLHEDGVDGRVSSIEELTKKFKRM